MTNQTIGRTTQTEFNRLKYQPGEYYCRCGLCSIFTEQRDCNRPKGIRDYELFNDPASSCCGGLCVRQPVCSRADPLVCSIGLTEKGENPLISYGWDRVAPNVQCVFDVDKIRTRQQLENYNNKFGLNPDVEASYCTHKVETCPPGIKECSRLFSVGEGATECNIWFNNLSADNKDAIMNDYCRKHNTAECKCINRFDEKTYKAMKGYKSFNDACWYAPCLDGTKNFISQHLVNPTCPDKICQQLYEFINDKNISVDNIKQDIACDFSSFSNNSETNTSDKESGPNYLELLCNKFIQCKYLLIILLVFVIMGVYFRAR